MPHAAAISSKVARLDKEFVPSFCLDLFQNIFCIELAVYGERRDDWHASLLERLQVHIFPVYPILHWPFWVQVVRFGLKCSFHLCGMFGPPSVRINVVVTKIE